MSTLRTQARQFIASLDQAVALSGRQAQPALLLRNALAEFIRSDHPLLDSSNPASLARGYVQPQPPAPQLVSQTPAVAGPVPVPAKLTEPKPRSRRASTKKK